MMYTMSGRHKRSDLQLSVRDARAQPPLSPNQTISSAAVTELPLFRPLTAGTGPFANRWRQHSQQLSGV
jgi:hypothetical protein